MRGSRWKDCERADSLIARLLSHQGLQGEAIERCVKGKCSLLRREGNGRADNVEKNWFLGDKRLLARSFRFPRMSRDICIADGASTNIPKALTLAIRKCLLLCLCFRI